MQRFDRRTIAVAFAAVLLITSGAGAYTAGRDSKVLLLHGRQCNANSSSSAKNHMQTSWWRNADSTLEGLGWSGTGVSAIKLGYYSDKYTVAGTTYDNYDVWALKHWKGSESATPAITACITTGQAAT